MLHHKVLFVLLWGLAYVVSLLPLRSLYLLSDFCFFVGYYIIGYRRLVIIQNLSRSFPDKKYKEIAQITKKFTHYFFDLFAEWLKLVSASERSLNKRIKFENPELLEGYMAEGKNVILIMGHYGNWECLNLLTLYAKCPIYAVYKKIRNPILNMMSAKLRARFGVGLLESKEVSRFILKHRKTPSVYLFIADQSPSRLNQECFLFLNQLTTAFSGVEKLAQLADAAVMYVEVLPGKRGCYSVSTVDMPTDKPITANFLNLLESSIKKAPEYWLWSHRRWKHSVKSHSVCSQVVAPEPAVLH